MLQLKDPTLLRHQAYVNGAWMDADGGQTINVSNPATGEHIGTVPLMGAAETRRAIKADNYVKKLLVEWSAKGNDGAASQSHLYAAAMRLPEAAPEMSGVAQMGSSLRPLSAASQSGLR